MKRFRIIKPLFFTLKKNGFLLVTLKDNSHLLGETFESNQEDNQMLVMLFTLSWGHYLPKKVTATN